MNVIYPPHTLVILRCRDCRRVTDMDEACHWCARTEQ
jgi:hypothetical protein